MDVSIQPYGVVELITPEVAKEYLKHNLCNRKVTSHEYVSSLARDMKNGKWALNYQPIVFDENGVLKDGQHRLNAVMLSGVSVPMFVVRGINSDVTLFDKGKARTIGDTLSMKGIDVSNRNTTIPLVRMNLVLSGIGRPTDEEIISEYIGNKERYDDVVSMISPKIAGLNITRNSTFGYLLYKAYESGVEESIMKRFTYVTRSGFYERKSETPAIVLRNMVLANKSNFTLHTGKSSRTKEILSIMEQSLHDFVIGKERKLQYKPTDLKYYFKGVK